MSDSYSVLKSDDEMDGPITPGAGSATSSSVDSNLSDNNAYLAFPPLDKRGGFPALCSEEADESDRQHSDQATTLNPNFATTNYFSQTHPSDDDGDDSPAMMARDSSLGLDTVFEVEGIVTDESTAASPSVAADDSTAAASIPGSISTTASKMSPAAMSDLDGRAGEGAEEGRRSLFLGKAAEDYENRSLASSDSAIALLVLGSQGSTSPASESTRSTTSSRPNNIVSSPDGTGAWGGPPPEFGSFDKTQPVLVFGRFEVHRGDPLYYSDKETFLLANDHWTNPPSRVILKLMTDPRQVVAELESRKGIDDAFVLKCLGLFVDQEATADEFTSYNGPIKVEKHEGLARALQTSLASLIKRSMGITNDGITIPTFPYCLSLQPYDRTLEQVLSHSYVDLSVVRSIAKDVVVAMILLHTEKRVHGDVKPRSIVRVGTSWKLCDLQSSRLIGEPCDVSECNHAYMPPEVATRLLDSDAEHDVPYAADSFYDIFSLGCILYHLIFGSSLWNADKSGHICDNELNQLAKWSLDSFFLRASIRFPTHQRTDDLKAAIDLISKLLAPTPNERRSNFQFGIVSVRQHEFLAGKPLECASLDAFIAKQDAMFQSETEYQSYLQIMQALSLEERWDLKRAKDVLLLGAFEPQDVHVPTSFVILKKKLPTKRPAETTTRQMKKTLAEAMKWVDCFDNLTLSVQGALDGDVPAIGHFWVEIAGMYNGDAMYLYLIDELTGEPVRGDGTNNEYPLEITTRSDTMPKLLPLMHLTMRAMALYHGVAGVARMFGCSVSAVPEDLRITAQSKINELKLENSTSPFGNITDQISGRISTASSTRHKSVRELVRFLKKVGRNNGDGGFAGLTRYPDENGRAIWTVLKDSESIKQAMQTRADERLKEERNLWADRHQEEIDKLEKDLKLEKEQVANLDRMLAGTKKDAETASGTAKDLESKLWEVGKSLDETKEQVASANRQLEEEMQKPKCGKSACVVS